jgi:hypothetical protein
VSKQDAVFVGVGIYSFAAVGVLWMLGHKESFGWFCIVALAGMPLPFIIDYLWERLA